VIAGDAAATLRQIRVVTGDCAVREKLDAMRQAYLGFHSEESFAAKLAQLLAHEGRVTAMPCNSEKG
jgi:hypothetical protein